jgi:Peptidase M15
VISLEQFFMGRDKTYAHILGSDLRANASRTVEAANKLLTLAKGAGVQLKPGQWGMVRSGWRPPAINASTQGASKTSYHMQCLAVDLEDVDRSLGKWCKANAQTVLKDLALWLEDPDFTPPKGDTRRAWCHVQLKPPGSGNRVFRP